MKSRSIGSLLLIAALAPSCGSGGGGGDGVKHPITPPRWSESYRKPTSVDLRAVRFGNPLSGIAAGKFGTFVRTDDGGTTWVQLEHTPASLTGDVLAMQVAQTTTFAVGSNPAGGTVAWQSLDATTFDQPDTPPPSFPQPWVDVSLVIPASNHATSATYRLRPNGMVDLVQGSLVASYDSTFNFVLMPPNPAFTWQEAKGITFFGVSGYGLVCGRDGSGNGAVRVTSNTGLGWFPTRMPAALPQLNRFSMINEFTGYACGNSGAVVTIVPDPGMVIELGQYWDNVGGAKPAITQNLNGIQFLDKDTGWIVGNAGVIYRIRNASTTPAWDTQTSGTAEDLYDVFFTDPSNGYAVGNNGVVVKTGNGGVTWTVKSGPAVNPTPTFNAVDFTFNAAVGLAVGNNGTLVRSLDGGLTWSTFNTGIGPANLTAVSIPRQGSTTVAFVGSDTGAIFFNTNLQGPGTWTAATSGAFPTAIKALLFPKSDTAGLVTGAAGNYARLTYTPAVVTPPTAATLAIATQALVPAPGGTNYAAACDASGNNLYIAGDGGYVVKSIDGGATWAAVVPAAPNVSIRALQAPTGPGYTLFAGAADGNVHRLSAGTTPAWTPTTTANFGTPASLAFINDVFGWVVTQGANGGVFYTMDSGTVWTRSVLHVPTDATAPHTLNAIYMHPAQQGVVVGGNGVILQTTTGGQ
ncbi:MAG TPA: YCF48-related protein [Planctomycetota bacterium]|nr:YCF48-related protein [Planctomycetota bacterium]